MQPAGEPAVPLVDAPAGLPPEARRMVDDLVRRSATLPTAQLRARIRAAGQELVGALEGLTDRSARARPAEGGWTLAMVADHVAQSTVRAAEELRHLLAGRRPPAPPVYEGLLSGAADRLPWATLAADLRSSLEELDRALAEAPAAEAGAAPPARGPVTAPAILAVPRGDPGPGQPPEIVFTAELDWRAYALVQRLHLLDHRTQARQLRTRLGA